MPQTKVETVRPVMTVKNACVVTPTPTRIIVQVDPFKYYGLLEIPENARRTPTTGTVVAIGKDITLVKEGDRITFGMYSGTGLVLRDKNTHKDLPMMRAITEDEVIGWLNEDIELIESGS